jgi:hypothetical protein
LEGAQLDRPVAFFVLNLKDSNATHIDALPERGAAHSQRLA